MASLASAAFVCLVAATVALPESAPHVAEVDPVDRQVAEIRGLLARNVWREALTLAREAVSAAPTDARLGAVLAEGLFRAGELEEAEAILGPIAEDPAAPPRALVTLGRLHSARGRTDLAEPLLDRAVAAAPDDREVLFWAGDLANRRERAIALLKRYLELSEGDDPDRIESVGGTLDVFEALGDRRTWVATGLPETLEIPLVNLGDGHGRTMGYLLEVKLGSRKKPTRLMLDTGSHGLFVLDRIVNKKGFRPLATKTLYGGGGKRRHESRRGLISPVSIGDLIFEDALVTSTPDELDATGRFHGLLGVAIFGGHRVTLDRAAKQLRLSRDSDPTAGSPYWWISGQLLVRVEAGDGTSGLFVFDTGATQSVVAKSFVERVDEARLLYSAPVRAFGGIVAGAKRVQGIELTFQGHSTGGSNLIAYDFEVQSRLSGVEVSGLLGLDVLDGRQIVIDTVAQRILLQEGRE